MSTTTTLHRIDHLKAQVVAILNELAELRTELYDEAQEAAGRPAEVIAVVAVACGSTVDEVRGKSMYKGAVRARHAVCVALTDCGLGLSEIGRLLGLDHSTVRNAIGHRAKYMAERGFRLAVERGREVWNGETPAPMQRLTFGHPPDCGCPICEAGRPGEAVGA